LRAAAALLVALALTGCETTAEKSARLERAAKLAGHGQLAQAGLSIARESRDVSVISAKVLHSSEGAAAVVTLRNASSHALRAVPIAITVTDARGAKLFQNNAPGLESTLVSVPSLPPHGELVWVDDQVPANGAPASVSARLGEAATVAGSLPRLVVGDVHLIEDPTNGIGAAGTVGNRSGISQRNVAVFVVASRGTRIVAAGKAVLPEVAAGSTSSFQVFFVGDPRGAGRAGGARLQASAPPTTLG
jgi:hypothetical protein